jgi:hypothetical protein
MARTRITVVPPADVTAVNCEDIPLTTGTGVLITSGGAPDVSGYPIVDAVVAITVLKLMNAEFRVLASTRRNVGRNPGATVVASLVSEMVPVNCCGID